MRLSVLAFAVALLGCGKAPDPAGTVEFRFDVSDTVRNSPNLTSPLKGSAYGAIFLQEDVSISGPSDTAQQYGDVTADGLDCTSAPSGSGSLSLAPGLYTFLGFFDVNGNGGVSKDPDPGDPVTLPFTNKFEIKNGEHTKRLVLFELVYN